MNLNVVKHHCDRNVIFMSSIAGLILVFNLVIFGFLHGILVFAFYLAGIYCWKLSYCDWLSLCSTSTNSVDNKIINAASCQGCNVEEKCPVFVSYKVDEALNQVFCRIIDQYISSWYCHVSSDNWFEFEIRSTVHHIITALSKRLVKDDVYRLILRKVIPICLNHITKIDSNPSSLHIAVHSRKSELYYVQNLSKHLLKHLLPQSSMNCKSFAILWREIISRNILLSFSDAVCNPSFLNHLILRYSDENFDRRENLQDRRTELLRNFLNVYEADSRYSSLNPDVNEILKDKELLNAFMCYLKTRETEHVLQFCLDVASFNEKMLKPELEAEELDDLYRDAWDLFSVYFSSYSPNCIHFHKDLASPLRKALSKDILKLRTTSTLFEAYEYAFSLLAAYCKDFHNSGEFYHWLYGRGDESNSITSDCLFSTTLSPRSVRSVAVSKESFGRKTIHEIGHKFNKIKEALKADSVLEGRFCDSENFVSDCESQFQLAEVGVDAQLTSGDERNLQQWKISVPSLVLKSDSFTNEAFIILVIRVSKNDNCEWSVKRRLCDLYELNLKLTEIYGQLTDSRLPPLETQNNDNSENAQFLYESYLNELIHIPELSNNELLYAFLTYIKRCEKDDEGTYKCETTRTGVGNVDRPISATSKRERGQNLNDFVGSLISSCCVTSERKKNLAKNEKKITNKISKTHAISFEQLYANNYNVDANTTRRLVLSDDVVVGKFRIEPSLLSLMIFSASKIYCLRAETIRILLTIKAAFGSLIDQYMSDVTKAYFGMLVENCNVASLINAIEWALFDDQLKYNDEQTKRKISTLLNSEQNSYFHRFYLIVFENLQDVKKNKQLFYSLTDAIIEEVFPETFASVER